MLVRCTVVVMRVVDSPTELVNVMVESYTEVVTLVATEEAGEVVALTFSPLLGRTTDEVACV